MARQRVRDVKAFFAAPQLRTSRIRRRVSTTELAAKPAPSPNAATSPTSCAHEPATSHTVRVETSGPNGSRLFVALFAFIESPSSSAANLRRRPFRLQGGERLEDYLKKIAHHKGADESLGDCRASLLRGPPHPRGRSPPRRSISCPRLPIRGIGAGS
jgi:hypothetical protein